MGKEIERRFLIDPSLLPVLPPPKQISQFYLSLDPERTVRVRLVDEHDAFLTVKGAKVGATCPEFEYPIPLDEAKNMATLHQGSPIHKERYIIPVEDHRWEVDRFLFDNTGLWIAEIELGSEDEPFVMPEWVVREITHDGRYANASLAQFPYTKWSGAGSDRNCSPG